MLDPQGAGTKGLEVNFQLTDRERAILSSAVKQEWFDIIQKLMEEEIRILNVHLINTPASDDAAIIANHRIAKAAGMFYSGFFQRLKDELQLEAYNNSNLGTPENPEKLALPPEFE